jgi:hypothetical protein
MSKVNFIVVGESVTPKEDRAAQGWRAKPRLMGVLAVFGFASPVVAYFWIIHHYGVNVIRWDQWNDVQIIGDSYSGKLSFGALWALHNENRILFPNLIVLLLGRTTSLNILFEEYFSGVLLVASIGLLIFAHRRRVGPIPWVYYCPVAILMLSFVQSQNTLWGFQMAWYLVLLGVAVALVFLDRPTLTWWLLAFAIASAVVASFSSLQGLIIWPVGLLLLYYRRRPKAFAVAWITVAVVTAVAYFVNDHYGPGEYALRHPIAAMEFYLVIIGDIVGANVNGSDLVGKAVGLLGLVIVLASIWVLATYCRGRDELSGRPIAAALICFGLLFAAWATEGRTAKGLLEASQSRYTTFDLLIVVGLYMVLLEQCVLRWSQAKSTQPAVSTDRSNRSSRIREVSAFGYTRQRSFPILAVVVTAIVCAQFAIGIATGLAGARADHASQVLEARVVVNLSRYADIVVFETLGAGESVPFLRQMAEIAKRDRLSLFATDAVAEYKAEGLIAGLLPATSISVPKAGALLQGVEILSATTSRTLGVVTKVEFTITGEGLNNAFVAQGKPYRFGWGAEWNTKSVPNGEYMLKSVAYDSRGSETHSPGIAVVVENK